MGGDGGSIPKRRELVKTNRNKEKISKEDSLKSKWQHCALSQQLLQSPVVACQLGRLFNKEALINFLLDKSTGSPQFSYITSLKDVKELNLSTNCEYVKSFGKAGPTNINSEFICPITGIEMSGRFKFVYFFTCGCVLSERAYREITDNTCLKCNKVFDKDDAIIINGDDEETVLLVEKMNNRKLQKCKRKQTHPILPYDEPSTKLNKTEKPEYLSDKILSHSHADSTSANKAENIDGLDNIKLEQGSCSNVFDINYSTDSVFASTADNVTSVDNKINTNLPNTKLMVGQGALSFVHSKSKKCDANLSEKIDDPKVDEGCKSHKEKSHKEKSRMKKQCTQNSKEKVKSIQDDQNASAAYKSLFSTHETAKRQAKAHWVTYNPLFY